MDLLLKRRRIIASQRGEDTTDYTLLPLTFKCLTGGDLSIKNANGSYDRNFEYSLNGGTWTAFDLPKNTASKLIATLSPNDTISFRRDNDNFADAQFISDSNLTFNIYGNLLSLQYGSAFNGQTSLRNTAKKAFGTTFRETNVVDASKLMLTAPILSSSCYESMFLHCTSLVSAPIIFATTLGANSCKQMFSECYNLINVQPQLYATTLSTDCCTKMFNDCKSLVNAPILPAVSLAQNCYDTMFRNCYSLTDAPELPATTMAKNCYYGMFSGCTSLTTAPELPATTLAEECYKSMFIGCTSLITVPELPVTTLAIGCYNTMFRNCASLATAPSLPATTLTKGCYYGMFSGCTGLVTAPELPAKTLVQECYYDMFNGCNRLNYIKCLATDGFSTSFCLNGWVANVSSIGTFVKASGVTWPSGNSGIPNGWNEAVEIEYLESSGTQYIDTGVTPNVDDYVEIKFQTKNTSNDTRSWFGYMDTSILPRFSIGVYGLGFFAGLNSTINLTPKDTNIHIIGFKSISGESHYILYDDVEYIHTTTHSLTPIPASSYLFARHGPNGVQTTDGLGTKIWYLKQKDSNENLRIDFVPVRVGSVGYMLDLVSKQLFGNAGTGDFILGPDKTY